MTEILLTMTALTIKNQCIDRLMLERLIRYISPEETIEKEDSWRAQFSAWFPFFNFSIVYWHIFMEYWLKNDTYLIPVHIDHGFCLRNCKLFEISITISVMNCT